MLASHSIRAVLFDFGGVLAEEGFHDGLVALAEAQGLDAAQLPMQGMRAVYDSGFVLGRGSAADFWALLRRRCGLKGDDAVLTEKILAGFRLRPRMLDLVRRLRAAGYATAILSDQTHWLDELDARYHFKEAFDRVYNSYYLGKGKRDPSLFADLVVDLGSPAATLLFVDDNLGNVNRARAAGWGALLFTDENSVARELERLLE